MGGGGVSIEHNRLLNQLSRHVQHVGVQTHASPCNFHMMSHQRKPLTRQEKIPFHAVFTKIAEVSILNGIRRRPALSVIDSVIISQF